MTPTSISIAFLLVFAVAASEAVSVSSEPPVALDVGEDDRTLEEMINDDSLPMEHRKKLYLAKKMRDTIKSVKQLEHAGIERVVRNNFLHNLLLMANASAITGQNTSRAAATLIRGFVQDSFNLGSIAAYFPRLIFLDGPTQFIETLRLIRANQLRVPMDLDSAIDTLINFAGMVRESQGAMNLGTPFLSFFPNVFRGVELLSTELLFNVFGWLVPLNPADVALPSIDGLWNRWDTKTSTTAVYDVDKRWRPNQGH